MKLPYSSSLKRFQFIKASCKTCSNLTRCAFWRLLISSSCSKFSKICLPWKQNQHVQVAEHLARNSPKGSAKVDNVEDSGMFSLPRKVCRRNHRSSPGKEEKWDKQMSLLIHWVSFLSPVKWNNPLAHVVVLCAPKLTCTTHSQHIPKPQALFSLGPSQLLQLKEKPCTEELK